MRVHILYMYLHPMEYYVIVLFFYLLMLGIGQSAYQFLDKE